MAKKEETEQLTPQQEKMKALQAAMAKIEKDFGKGSIMRMGEESVERCPWRRWLSQGTYHRNLWS